MKQRSRSGVTLLELILVLAAMTVVLAAAVLAVRKGQEQFERTVSNTVLDTQANRAINRIARHLSGAGLTTLLPTPDRPFGSSSLRFQRVVGWGASAPLWSTEAELLLRYEPGELDNGLDDDGDGAIDEGEVVWTRNRGEPDEESVVVVRSVREFLEGEEPDGNDTNGNGLEDERGFCFELLGGELIVRLSVVRRDPTGALNLRTLETSVALRN